MELKLDILNAFDKGWALVTAGTPEHFNTMTVSWGGLGTLWRRPVATVYVKPVRYTHEFLEANDLFTVSFFPERYRKDLALLGTKSGRDCDKVALTALTPKELDGTVGFAEASVTVVCKKIYRQDLDLAQMPQDVIETYYETEAPHTLYVGEILRIERK